MHICKMEIQNYRSLRAFTIELKPTTLIIGENNIGKTNLLNAISLILNNEIISYQKRGLSISDFNYDTVQSFKKSVADLTVISSDIDFPTITIEATFTDFNNDERL